MNPRLTIRQVARRVQHATGNRAQDAQASVTQAVRAANLKEIPETSWSDLRRALEHDPVYGLALARVLQAIANSSRKATWRAQADLALLYALNVSGEFESVIGFAVETARRLDKTPDKQSLARVWLEAAWAETYRGDLAAAEKYLARGSNPPEKSGALELTLLADWIRARILRERGENKPALALLVRVRAGYISQGRKYDAMRVLREIGSTNARIKPSDGVRPLNTARAFFVKTKCPVEVALCDLHLAIAALDLNRFTKAAAYLERAQQAFRIQHTRFFQAWANLEIGFLCWFTDRPTEMLEYSQRAHTLFVELNAVQEIASTAINIGVALVALNRYAQAIPFYTSGLEHSQSTGRTIKAAVCLLNLADVYIKQGQPARALEHLLRARAMFVRSDNVERIIECDLSLANVYVGVSSYKNAFAALDRARRLAAHEKMTTRLAQSELYRAQLYLLRGQVRRSPAPLRRARTRFARNNQTSHVAWCDRLLAELVSSHRKNALARLDAARATFRKQRQFVEVALCDLTRGELYLRWREWKDAARALSQAEEVLHTDLPDQHARILYGLGRLAQGQNQEPRALQYMLRSAQTLAQVRRTMGLESLSNSFFGARQMVVRDGLQLARKLDAPAEALALIQAAKAQTFTHALPVREWRLQQADTRIRELEHMERELYDRLAGERARLVMQLDSTDSSKPPTVRGFFPKKSTLETLAREYERVAQELRLARQGFAGVPELDPFSLQAFRQAATRRWGDAWLALDYLLVKGQLYIVSVGPTELTLDVRRWGWHEQHLLRQATHGHPDVRELVFDHTLHGQNVPMRENPLAELAKVLLPPHALALAGATLLIAPHQLLHQLAFQALEINGAPLATRVTIAYTPTLQAYTQLCEHAPRVPADMLLVCGVQNFAAPLPELKYAHHEVNEIHRQHPDATVLWQDRATRAQLVEWNQTGRLREFSMLHFATHATVRADAPHLSAIQLDKQEVTILDLTNFALDARLVTLSACSGNVGKGGSGDEWVSLARAFFYAGARALVASLWQVQDESTSKLMRAFYRELSGGVTISGALHAAQLELIRAGAPPSQWAPFVAIGDV